jgi:hypothetical protein
MSDLETWQVFTDSGNDGPYTLEQLRHKVETGRLRPDDKLLSNKTREATHVSLMFPEAVAMARRTTSERIKRRTGSSGRMAASSAAKVDDAITAMAADAANDPVVPTAIKPITGWHGRKRAWWRLSARSLGVGALAVTGAVAATFTLSWIYDSLSGSGQVITLSVPAAQTLEGSWIVDAGQWQARFKDMKLPNGEFNPMATGMMSVAKGFAFSLTAGQATITTSQGTITGAVTVTPHPGTIIVIWSENHRREMFSVIKDQVAWQSITMSVPLIRSP